MLIVPAPSLVTAVASEVKCKFDKVIDLKHPTMENIKEFWYHVNDPSFSDKTVISKMSIVVKQPLELMLQHKPPDIRDISLPVRSVRIGI